MNRLKTRVTSLLQRSKSSLSPTTTRATTSASIVLHP
jgi:hypothetical protein